MIFLLLVILISVVIVHFVVDRIKHRDFYKIKGPKSLPIVGNAHLLGKTPLDAFRAQIKFGKEFGSFYRLLIGPFKTIVISEPDLLEKILSSNKHIKKSFNYDMLQNWLGYGLVNSSGPYWRKHRKLITPAFHFKSLQDYATYMAKHLKTLMEVLNKNCNKDIDIHKYIKLYALDTICDSAMRHSIRAQLDSESTYVQSLKTYLDIHMTRFFSVLLRPAFVFYKTQKGKTQMKAVRTMHDFTDNVIAIRKKERVLKSATVESQNTVNSDDEFSKVKPSFLDLLLDKQENEFLSDTELRDEVSTFMFAGSDTVSSTVSFCLYELAKHPDVQQRLVEESWSVMGKNCTVNVNTNDIQELSYLDMVVKECMRIYTTVPMIERDLEEDIVLNGLKIRKGTVMQINIYDLHWSEKLYPNPERFDPERFTLENTKARHAYSYIPFSAGPRNCIGFKYGILLTKSTVINILRNFELLQADHSNYEPILLNTAILESKNGIRIRLRPRILKQ